MSLEDWMQIQEKIKFTYANSNEYSEIKNNQILDMRIATANNADQLVGNGYLSKVFVQENILRLTDEEMKRIDQENAIANAAKSDDEFNSDVENSDFGDEYNVSRRGSSSPTMGMGGGSFSKKETPIDSEKPTDLKGEETNV